MIFNEKAFSFSLFATDPSVQGKYFPHMKSDADLERHGVRVFNAIGAMVKACKDEDDATLVKKIHEVGVRACVDSAQCVKYFIAFDSRFFKLPPCTAWRL